MIGAGGVLELATAGSTQPITQTVSHAGIVTTTVYELRVPAIPPDCQSAFKFDPASASNFDPFGRRVLAVALAPSELVGVAETVRARAA